MSFVLNVEWTVRRAGSPSLMRPCGRCGQPRPFRSTGKFRLNANGSRLDAWLIHACGVCGKTWNRVIFERQPVGRVPGHVLDALHSNDAAYACSIDRSRSNSGGRPSKRCTGFLLTERRQSAFSDNTQAVQLVIKDPDRSGVRLDKILAQGLGVSRTDVSRLAALGIVEVQGNMPKALRRPVPTKLALTVRVHSQERDTDCLRSWLCGLQAGC